MMRAASLFSTAASESSIEDARQFVVVDVDVFESGEQRGFFRMREKQDRLFWVIDCVRGEAGVIPGEMHDGVFAGDVGGTDDGVLGPIDVWREGDAADSATSNGGTHGCAVPHAGE